MVILIGENGYFGGMDIGLPKTYVFTALPYLLENSCPSRQEVAWCVKSNVQCTIDQLFGTHKGCKIYCIVYCTRMCISVCIHFKSQTGKCNATLFDIGNFAPFPWFDEVELIKQDILQELVYTVEARVVVHNNREYILLH